MKCSECGKGFSRDNSERNCWSLHVAYGGVPCPPIRGSMQRRATKSWLKIRDEAAKSLA